MRTAVVGHLEWIEFARVAHVAGSGEIEHALDWWEGPGGGGPVAAVQLHRLAGGCTFFTALGRDAVAKRATLELEGLGPRVEAAPRATTTRRAVTFLEPTGERTITTLGPRLEPRAEDPLPWHLLEDSDAAYFCAGDTSALRLARRARVLVVTSREAAVLRESGVRPDAVVGSATDPSERFDPADLTEPPPLVVRTEGAAGGTFTTADGRSGRYDAVPPPGPLVDAYGPGDCFAAGLTFGLASGLDVADALALGARCGAWCVAGTGPYEGMLTLQGP